MKLIIVDDEKWVRATIISQIPFNELGMTLCSEASNGIEALELCRLYEPDILVTDIKMPGLSGLELIKELKILQPDIKIIIISGHDDFEYARTALKYGVSDYILKPVESDEITAILKKVKEQILEERKQIEQHNYIKNQYNLAFPIMCEQFLNQLILPNSMTVNNIIGELEKYNIKIKHNYFTIAVLSPENAGTHTKNDIRAFKNLVSRIMSRYLNAVTFTSNQSLNEMVIIINHELDTSLSFLEKPLNLCIGLYKKKFNCNLFVGISYSVRELNKIQILYEQAKESILQKFWKQSSLIFYYEKELIKNEMDINISDKILEDILFNIKLRNYEPANHFIDKTYKQLMSGNFVNPSLVRGFFSNLVYTITIRLNIYKSFMDYESIFSNAQPYEKILSINTFDELTAYVKELIAHMGEHISDITPSDNKNIIESVKKIIKQNYYKDISLEQISKYVNLNATYFSELFKKETGMSFVYYKTLLRIETSKELLLTTNMSINKISEMVGYVDHKYFSKLFKKVTGMTMMEFKKS